MGLKEFKFQNVDLKTLLTKTIEISVWDKDFGKNDFIGMLFNSRFETSKIVTIYLNGLHPLQN